MFFWKFQILNGWDTQEGRTASACQILSKSIKSVLRYGDLSIFHDGGVRHLEFSKVENFNFQSHSEAQYASPNQISQRSVEPLRRYGRFSISRRRPPPSCFFGNFKFLAVGRSRGSNCVCMPNFVEIAQIRADIWRFFDFS